jgi:integrase
VAELKKKVTTRWLDAAGKRVKPHTPGASPVTTESRKWYATGAPLPRGAWRPLSRDKSVSQRMLAELVTRLERGAAGLADLADLKRPLAEWLDLFRAAMEAAPGADPVWCRQVHTRLSRLVAGCGFARAGDVDADRVKRWLAGRRALPDRRSGQLSQQTCNHYRAHLHALCAWLVERQVLTGNPADRVPVGDVRADLRHARRPFSPTDLLPFLEGVRTGGRVLRVSGPDRHALYLLACATGFRRKELAALRPSWFDLEAAPPTVLLPGRASKNGDSARQPLPLSVVPTLRSLLARQERGGGPLWPAKALGRTAYMLKRDLAAAGLPYVVDTPEGPRHLDFHALRHTYSTLVIEAGATVKEAQVLLRHKDPGLTIGRYTHAGAGGLADCVNRLPLGAPPEGRTLEDLPRAELLQVARWGLAAVAALVAASGVPLCHSTSPSVLKTTLAPASAGANE